MTELLIGAVSWLATFGFIVAAIAEAFDNAAALLMPPPSHLRSAPFVAGGAR